MIYTVYNETTGQIIQILQTDDIALQIQNGQNYIEGAIDDTAYYIANGVAVAIPAKPDQYSIFDFTTKQWVQNETMAITDVSTKRKKLLYASDWTQIPNNPLTSEQQEEWATYRQELRDIPSQSGYPFNVIFPTPPG